MLLCAPYLGGSLWLLCPLKRTTVKLRLRNELHSELRMYKHVCARVNVHVSARMLVRMWGVGVKAVKHVNSQL